MIPSGGATGLPPLRRDPLGAIDGRHPPRLCDQQLHPPPLQGGPGEDHLRYLGGGKMTLGFFAVGQFAVKIIKKT